MTWFNPQSDFITPTKKGETESESSYMTCKVQAKYRLVNAGLGFKPRCCISKSIFGAFAHSCSWQAVCWWVILSHILSAGETGDRPIVPFYSIHPHPGNLPHHFSPPLPVPIPKPTTIPVFFFLIFEQLLPSWLEQTFIPEQRFLKWGPQEAWIEFKRSVNLDRQKYSILLWI